MAQTTQREPTVAKIKQEIRETKNEVKDLKQRVQILELSHPSTKSPEHETEKEFQFMLSDFEEEKQPEPVLAESLSRLYQVLII